MKQQVAKSLFWMVWSKGGIQILSFVSTLTIARWLNPEDYGVMALVGLWTAIIGKLSEMGLGGAIVQFRDLAREELNTCFWLTLSAAGIAYLFLFATAPWIAAWFSSPRVAPALRVTSLALLLAPIQLVPDALLRKQLRLDRLAQAEMTSALLTIPVMLTLAWQGAGVWALVVGGLLQACLHTAYLLTVAPWWPGWRVDSRRLQGVLQYSLSAVGANMGWSLFAQVDTVIVGKLAGEQALGVYTMAKQLALLPVTKIAAVVNQLSFPLLAGWQDDPLRLRMSFLRILRLVACVTIPMSLGVALLASDIVGVALGARWHDVIPLLQIFCLYALVHSLEVLLPPVLMARYRTGFLFLWTAGLVLTMPVPFAAAAWWKGALGVAVAWSAVYPWCMAPMAREAFRELGISPRMAWTEIQPSAFAAILMATGVQLVLSALPDHTVADRVLRLACGPLVGILAYGLLLRWGSGQILEEVLEVARWVIGRQRSHRGGLTA